MFLARIQPHPSELRLLVQRTRSLTLLRALFFASRINAKKPCPERSQSPSQRDRGLHALTQCQAATSVDNTKIKNRADVPRSSTRGCTHLLDGGISPPSYLPSSGSGIDSIGSDLFDLPLRSFLSSSSCWRHSARRP